MSFGALEQPVVDMHSFFGQWFSGLVPQAEAEFAKFENLLDPGFTLINPDGTVSTYDMVVRQMENYYAKVPGLVVECENFSVIAGDENLVVASYDELQRWPAGANSRRTTMLFAAHSDSAYGYRMRHGQETWLEVETAAQN